MIIAGTYGTGKYKLALNLAKYGIKSTNHVFHVPYENLFARMEENTFVGMLDEFIISTPNTENRLFLVVVPSWLNAASIIPLLNETFNVKTVIATISVGGFYASKNGALTDNVLTFAVPGFAQSIVLDSRG